MLNNKLKPFKLGITGGIATGKSLVRIILNNMGIPTVDADEIVHDLLKNDITVINQILKIFDKSILDNNGGINRKELSKLVFEDRSKLKSLENIVHPKVYEKIDDFVSKSDKDIVAIVIPLLFETQAQHLFDTVWVITAEQQQQINRLKLRDNMSEEEALQRIACQMPQNLKIAMANTVIDNSQTIDLLVKQVEDSIEKIKMQMIL